MKRKQDDLDKEESKKIKIEDDTYMNTLNFDDCSDVFLGLKMIKGLLKNSYEKHKIPPLLLKHMIYPIFNNNTMVDKNLEEFIHSGKIRQFYLNSLQKDGICYLFTEDYLKYFTEISEYYKNSQLKLGNELKKDLDSPNRKLKEKTVDFDFDKLFIDYVDKLLPKCTETFVTRKDLKEKMDCDEIGIDHLLKMGLFRNKDEETLWYSIPNGGKFMDSLVKGRKEIISMIKKKKFKEILLRDLLRKGLKTSQLSVLYLMKDMISLNQLQMSDTHNGKLVSIKSLI